MVHCAIIHWPHCIILNLFHLNILLEPVLAPIWAWAGVGEKPPMIELLGGLIVFAFVTWRLVDQFIEKEKNN